jgi:serine/threonine protein kinase
MKQVNMKKLSEAQKSGVLKEVYVYSLRSRNSLETNRNSFPFHRQSSPIRQILCSLDHPNIVKVHSFEYDDKIQKNYMFIYMEVSSSHQCVAQLDVVLTLALSHQLCEGGDLHALIDKRVTNKDYLPEVRIWVIISQLVSALNHMHNRSQSDKSVLNVLHRDIKPENSASLPLPSTHHALMLILVSLLSL